MDLCQSIISMIYDQTHLVRLVGFFFFVLLHVSQRSGVPPPVVVSFVLLACLQLDTLMAGPDGKKMKKMKKW